MIRFHLSYGLILMIGIGFITIGAVSCVNTSRTTHTLNPSYITYNNDTIQFNFRGNIIYPDEINLCTVNDEEAINLKYKRKSITIEKNDLSYCESNSHVIYYDDRSSNNFVLSNLSIPESSQTIINKYVIDSGCGELMVVPILDSNCD